MSVHAEQEDVTEDHRLLREEEGSRPWGLEG